MTVMMRKNLYWEDVAYFEEGKEEKLVLGVPLLQLEDDK
jgi:hypothetical protein